MTNKQGILHKRLASRCPCVYPSGEEQIESAVRGFDTHQIGSLANAAQRQGRSVSVHDRDANAAPVGVGGAPDRRTRRHEIGVVEFDECRRESFDISSPGRIEP